MNLLRYNYDLPSVIALAALTRRSEKLRPQQLLAIQRKRFHSLLAHARKHSPFYGRLYRDLASDLSLNQMARLPSVTKTTVMDNFDDVLTDRSINKAAVLKFAENPANLGHPLQGKYFVARTSGTTGLVGHYIHDLFSYFLINITSAVRSKGLRPIALVRDWHFIPRRLRIASLLSPSANLGVASVIASAPEWVRLTTNLKLLDIFDPWESNIETLNSFQPDVLGSFPTILEQLALSQKEGTLRIRPRTVRSGGETLMPRVREFISKAFGCDVYDAYGCAETGWVGMECEARAGLHLFSDWVIVEPVDSNNVPVPPGIESDKILLTNLANYIQPFIRFELPDRVTVLEGDCACGSNLPRVLLKGRASEVLYLPIGEEKTVEVAPFHLTTLAEMVPGIGRYQIIQEAPGRLLVLFTPRDDIDSAAVGSALRSSFEDYFHKNGMQTHVTVTVRLTEEIQRDQSGKVRQIFSRVNASSK